MKKVIEQKLLEEVSTSRLQVSIATELKDGFEMVGSVQVVQAFRSPYNHSSDIPPSYVQQMVKFNAGPSLIELNNILKQRGHPIVTEKDIQKQRGVPDA